MPLSEAERVTRAFQADRAAGLWLEVAIPENAFGLCAELGRRYGPKFGLRTLDTLHVACALELKAERFWTLDERQAKLAKAVGLKTS
jgi:predicted nucleic acid-binding protein